MKKLFCIISAFVFVLNFSGCNKSEEELPRVTLVMYCDNYDDYPAGVFGSVKQEHSIIVYTDDGKIFSAEFEGGKYQDDPAWISPDSDDCYERLTKLAEGEPSGTVPEEKQVLIRDNYENFPEWTAAKLEQCGTIYDYMDIKELYVVFEDGGETRVGKLARLSSSPMCRNSAAAKEFAAEFLGSTFRMIL